MNSETLDFAIVGGGASGIYSAWRLAHASDEELLEIRKKIGGTGPLRIAVFERSHRIGGRLLSASPAAMPETTMELGGMRYLTNQPLVTALVEKKLDLPRFQQAVDEPGNFAYLRRKLFRQDVLDQPGVELPYNLTEAEKMVLRDPKTKTPAQLIFWAVYREFPELEGMSAEDMAHFLQNEATVDGKPLYQVGFWNLLSRHLSHEGRQLGITAIGYDVLGANANAVDIISENFDFTADSQYFLFKDGYEALIWELAEQFTARNPDFHSIHLGDEPTPERPRPPGRTTLEGFDAARVDGSDGFTLTFESGDTVDARAIVLALPKFALQSLRKKGPVLDPVRAPHVPRLINAVEGIPLYKLFVVYDTPWWHEKWGLEQGRSLTDLPVRQCYYWSTNVAAPSAIMAYNDQASSSFWGGYQTGPLGPLDTAEAGDAAREFFFHPETTDEGEHGDEIVRRRRANWNAHKAPKAMVEEMHRQLMEMHGVTDAPEPIDAAFMDWMNPPFGGAVHFWNPGNKSWEIKDRMTQPVEGVNAFVVGEAWSTVQTWVEGALQTSEVFLQKRLGMRAPDWLAGVE